MTDSDLFDFKAPTRRYALMGNPVSHSRSPFIHHQFGEQVGLSIEYTAIQVDPGGFTQAVDNFRANGGEGMNVTVPFKTEAANYADSVSDAVKLAGAANTLAFVDGTCTADNTDGVGLVNDLTQRLGINISGKRVLLVGAGGAARGAAGPLLAQSPSHMSIVNRNVDKAYSLVEQLADDRTLARGYDDLADESYDIVVNATAASLAGELAPLPVSCVAHCELAYDMMYASEPTVFMTWATANGSQAVADGLGMLVEQAAVAFHIWTGQRPETTPVLEAIRRAL